MFLWYEGCFKIIFNISMLCLLSFVKIMVGTAFASSLA